MKWFKAYAPDHELMTPIVAEFGLEGYGKFMAVWAFCSVSELHTLSIEVLKKHAACNERGAKKLLPLFQQTLTNVWQSFTKVSESLPKVSQTLPKLSESLPKLEAQNPHGSTRDQEENRKEKKRGEENTPLPPKVNFENLPTDYQPILTFINSTTKEQISEVDLLRRDCIQLINSSRVARINLLGDSFLDFCVGNPTARNMVYAWLKYPPAVRMAAIAYAFTCPHKANQFDWALKAIKGDWESYQKFIPACQLMVDAGDYTLEV